MSTCGGRIVRFSDTGEVIEIEATAEEPTAATGVPPLFANLETQYAFTGPAPNSIGMAAAPPVQPAYGPPLSTAVATSFGGAIGGTAPPNGYCQPSPAGGQPETSGHMDTNHEPREPVTHAQPGAQYQSPAAQNEDFGLAPPLPMGYYEADRPASPPPSVGAVAVSRLSRLSRLSRPNLRGPSYCRSLRLTTWSARFSCRSDSRVRLR